MTDTHTELSNESGLAGRLGLGTRRRPADHQTEAETAPAKPSEPATDLPLKPTTIDQLGLNANLLRSLVLKAMAVLGVETASEIAGELKIAGAIAREILEDAEGLMLLETRGLRGDSGAAAELRYALTRKGQEWAREALEQSQYIGPAPVTLAQFSERLARHRISEERITPAILEEAVGDLVLGENFIERLGPAVNSGRSVLFYGEPGNGKTILTERIARAFHGHVYIPYCIEVDGTIIKILDSTIHRPVQSEGDGANGSLLEDGIDPRWVLCHRPVVVTGGELTLDMLDLSFNPYSKYYEAPLQMKATGGLFVIDDFGRQRVSPDAVMNRWILPLEKGVDYLTLHTGKKFPVPFDALVMFSTNLPPENLFDAAQLRRVYYKVAVGAPTPEELLEILIREAESEGLPLSEETCRFLFGRFYADGNVAMARYHPRFIINQVKAMCGYRGVAADLSPENVAEACGHLTAS